MNRTLVAAAQAALVLALAPVAALAADGKFERTLTVTGAVDLHVVSGSGSITVRRGAAGAVVVRGEITANRGWGGVDDPLAAVRQVEQQPPVVQEGNTIRVGRLDEEVARRVSVSYDITVPESTGLDAKTGSGDIIAEGLGLGAQLQTGSGSVRGTDLGGGVSASAGSGDLALDGVGGALDASTGSGSIRASRVAGTVKARTGSGDVTVSVTGQGAVAVSAASGDVEVAGAKSAVEVRSASGDVTVDGAPGGAWSVQSASGDVSLRLPADAKFSLDAHSTSGRIDVGGLPVTVSGVISRRELKGDVRGGGPRIEVRTASGDVTIR